MLAPGGAASGVPVGIVGQADYTLSSDAALDALAALRVEELAAAASGDERAQLLDRLAEWDNFQSILTLTRDILGRQKSIRDKTADMTGNRSK